MQAYLLVKDPAPSSAFSERREVGARLYPGYIVLMMGSLKNEDEIMNILLWSELQDQLRKILLFVPIRAVFVQQQ